MPGHSHPAGYRAWLGLKRAAADSRFLPAPPQSPGPAPSPPLASLERSTWPGGRCHAPDLFPSRRRSASPRVLNRPSAGSCALVPTPCRVPRLLAALCGALLRLRTLAFSGELIAPPSRPSPLLSAPLGSSPPRLLCLRCLQTWSRPGAEPRGYHLSGCSQAGGDALGLSSWGWGLVGARGVALGGARDTG